MKNIIEYIEIPHVPTTGHGIFDFLEKLKCKEKE
jgi:hypothetical protein